MLECALVGKLLSLKALRRISDLVDPVNTRSCCESNTLSNPAIVRDVLGNGLRLLTERMTAVRSISIGVWLTRGSRHEAAERGGIAHFVEHMLFKGTTSRSAEDIAQAIDSIGGQLDAFTAKEYASYYIKVLDEHLPLAIDILSDIVRNPAFSVDDLEREKKVVVEEIKMVEDTPDRSSTSSSRRGYGRITRSAVRFWARAKRSSRSTPICSGPTSPTRTRLPTSSCRRRATWSTRMSVTS